MGGVREIEFMGTLPWGSASMVYNTPEKYILACNFGSQSDLMELVGRLG